MAAEICEVFGRITESSGSTSDRVGVFGRYNGRATAMPYGARAASPRQVSRGISGLAKTLGLTGPTLQRGHLVEETD